MMLRDIKIYSFRLFLFVMIGVTILGHADDVLAINGYDAFRPPVGLAPGSRVNSILQTQSGEIVVSGSFLDTYYTNMAVLTVDGTTVPNRTNHPSTEVHSMALQKDGKVLVVGWFGFLGTSAHSYIGRYNTDGSVDETLNNWTVDPNNGFRTVALQSNGKIIIGGDFTAIEGQPRQYIARLNTNGTLDTAFNTSLDDLVFALAVQSDDKILVGGDFANASGQAHSGIVRLSRGGNVDGTFFAQVNGQVHAIGVQPDGKIIIGGAFNQVNGQSVTNLVRVDAVGNLDSAFRPRLDGIVRAVAVQANGKVLFGGEFTTFNGQPLKHLGRLNVDGSIDASFKPVGSQAVEVDGNVRTIFQQYDGKILIGGTFTKVNNIARQNVARLYLDGSLDDNMSPDVQNQQTCTSVFTPDDRVIIGGGFMSLNTWPRNHFGSLRADGNIDITFSNNADSLVTTALVLPDGKLLIAGDFTQIGTWTRNGLACVNSTNGTLLDDFDSGLPGCRFFAMARQADGKIILGGDFTNVCDTTRYDLARLNADGSIDLSFTAGTDNSAGSQVRSIAIQPDGKIIVGGSFTNMCGQPRENLARLNTNGTLDTVFFRGVNSNGVNAIAVEAGGTIMIGGEFSQLDAEPVQNICRLNSYGNFSYSFTGTANKAVNSIAVQADGKIIVGGKFTKLSDSACTYLGRFMPSGELDSTFGSGLMWSNDVHGVTIQPDGKILLAGTISHADVFHGFGRVSQADAALQVLQAASNNITWYRSGASPEVWLTTFEQSLDGVGWTSLGDGTRTNGGWALTGLSLPSSTNVYIRARGYSTGGKYSSSGSIVESVRLFYLDETATGLGLPWLNLLLGQ